MDGVAALESGGGSAGPAPQPELPRRVRPARTTPDPPAARPGQPGAAGPGPAGPRTRGDTPDTAGPGWPRDAPGAAGSGGPGAPPGSTGPGSSRDAPGGNPWAPAARTGTTAPGSGRTAPAAPGAGTGPRAAGGTGGSTGGGSGATRAAGRPYGPDRAAIRPAPGHALPRGAVNGRAANGRAAGRAAPGGAARGQSAPAADAARGRAGEPARPAEADAAKLPWYEVAHARRAAEGYQNCGPLERVLRREWPPSKVPSPPVVRAVNRLAELPLMIKQILAAGVDAIHVGEGGVPELDDMGRLRGVALPSGRATWDACAGAYGERKIIVGSRPSSAPDVMCHEVGHALDDIDREQGRWQSDSAEFRHLYQRCEGSLVSDFHRQPGDLGRREFFADAFAAIASRQRPALVDMLGGNIRTALDVMLYFNLRYGL
jgi:hypothetical protein